MAPKTNLKIRNPIPRHRSSDHNDIKFPPIYVDVEKQLTHAKWKITESCMEQIYNQIFIWLFAKNW